MTDPANADYFREGEERESGARLTGAMESDVAADAALPTEARPVMSQTIDVTSAGTDGVAVEARKMLAHMHENICANASRQFRSYILFQTYI